MSVFPARKGGWAVDPVLIGRVRLMCVRKNSTPMQEIRR